MNILILNWKDIKNPLKGGAEILTHEIAKGLVENGHNVTLFVPSFAGCKEREVIDGISIVRSKRIGFSLPYNPTHFLRAMVFYFFHKNNFDIIIDELHGIPYFTPLYIKQRIFFLVCEVAGDIWDRTFRFPFNKLGRLIERWYFSLYKSKEVFTISPSTKSDLIKVGIPSDSITIIPMGIKRATTKNNYQKEKNPTYIFVGRMSKMKGIEDAIIAVSIIIIRYPLAKLWIIGDGDLRYRAYLQNKVKQLNINDNIIFFGFVSEEKKYEFMARAHAILVPSLREGFGLIVPEANSVGTPAIVYDSPGLRDIVKNGENGFISTKNTPAALAEILLKNQKKLFIMSALAKKISALYNWSNTLKIINEKIYSFRTAPVR